MRSFFKKLHHSRDGEDEHERNRQGFSAGPPPDYSDAKPSSSSKHAQQQQQQQQHHAPYEASSSSSTYAPPPGPPPNWAGSSNDAPASAPPPYHDWTIVPDNALLPPPPPMTYTTSPTANASAADGEAAYEWCLAHPLRSPLLLTPPQLAALAAGHVAFAPPPDCFAGELLPWKAGREAPGRYRGRTHSAARDAALLTALPLYAARAHNPVLKASSSSSSSSSPPKPTVVYFELGIVGVGGMSSSSSSSRSTSLEEADAGLAVGYVAPPFPAWRLPGWQRGSLGVHGDDGRRYVNDTFGGADFTTAWRAGERVGLGLVFEVPGRRDGAPPSYEASGKGAGTTTTTTSAVPKCDVHVFFTRNGKKEGGWDMAGELDERALGGKDGLEGECDLYGAVGVFGGVDFEVFFNRDDWLFKPEEQKW